MISTCALLMFFLFLFSLPLASFTQLFFSQVLDLMNYPSISYPPSSPLSFLSIHHPSLFLLPSIFLSLIVDTVWKCQSSTLPPLSIPSHYLFIYPSFHRSLSLKHWLFLSLPLFSSFYLLTFLGYL